MGDLSAVEIIACAVTILGGIVWLFKKAGKLGQKFVQKKRDTERELRKEIQALKSTGGNVSARTDLGFFITIYLGSLRHTVMKYSHQRTLNIVYFICCLLFMIIVDISNVPVKFVILFFGVSGVYCLISALMVNQYVVKYESIIEEYETRIKEIWRSPIDKKNKPKDKSE